LINREEPVVDPSGRPGWLLTSKAPLRDTRGRIIGLVGMGRDITDRKREEEQHRLSETRLQAILDNTTAVIYLKDTQGRYLLINRQFEDLFHVTLEQVVHKTDYDLFPGTMADAFRVNDQRVLETRTPLEFEEVAPRDGEIRTFISIKFPLWDTTGVPYAVCGISTDITERKRAETKLVAANAELHRMFGYELDTLIGKTVELLLPGALRNLHIGLHHKDTPEKRDEFEKLVYGITGEFGGSISAEHGIGILKRPYLKMSRTEEEIETMRTLKRALDPKNILNPGRIFTM